MIMDNQTIRNTFRKLKEGEKLVLTCSEHIYSIYPDDIMCLCSGNDLQITKGNSRGIPSQKQETIYIDCTYVQCMSIKPKGGLNYENISSQTETCKVA